MLTFCAGTARYFLSQFDRYGNEPCRARAIGRRIMTMSPFVSRLTGGAAAVRLPPKMAGPLLITSDLLVR